MILFNFRYLYYIYNYWKIGGNFDLDHGGIGSANVGKISPVQVAEWFYFDKEWVYDQTLEIRNRITLLRNLLLRAIEDF